ncbi:hypothetical protein L6452_43956 [Arctium lappa]|uniref:Uncharacterized protein n=1 Tax=Arctium lappa TaxID=4217 RepID=A0ACB8XDT0_ARCLA|nr:hypothetical protein L6452_43956 [Arctium lappa]
MGCRVRDEDEDDGWNNGSEGEESEAPSVWSEGDEGSEDDWFVEESRVEEKKKDDQDRGNIDGGEVQSVRKTQLTGKPSGEVPEKEEEVETSKEKGDKLSCAINGDGELVPEVQVHREKKSINEQNQIKVNLVSKTNGSSSGLLGNSNHGPYFNTQGNLMDQGKSDGPPVPKLGEKSDMAPKSKSTNFANSGGTVRGVDGKKGIAETKIEEKVVGKEKRFVVDGISDWICGCKIRVTAYLGRSMAPDMSASVLHCGPVVGELWCSDWG